MTPALRLMLLTLCGWGDAPDSAQTQQTYAVVVGISDYRIGRPGRGGDLRFADDDARLFYLLLRSPTGGNVPASNIRLLTDQRATRANILKAMSLFQQATPADRVIFFFSGHGDRGVLLPYDVRPGVVVWHSDVKAAFRRSSAQTKMLLADACMAGSMRAKLYAPPNSLTTNTNSTPPDTSSNVVVLLSSRPNQPSQETSRLQQGIFTYFLVQGANGAADRAGNRNGIVTIEELYKYLRQHIGAMTQNRQTPVVFGRFSKTMPFSYVGS
jgi:hypothetical protein